MRTLVIIDGSNFYHQAKKLCPEIHLSSFDYRSLIRKIVGSSKVDIQYCVGEIKQNKTDKKSVRLYSGQQSLFYNLSRQKIRIEKGFMLHSNGSFHEKGVDVRIAVNILKGALKDLYDTCYLVSSDTDLIPAIKESKLAKKKVVYVAFENFVSNALRVNCNKTYIITKDLLMGEK